MAKHLHPQGQEDYGKVLFLHRSGDERWGWRHKAGVEALLRAMTVVELHQGLDTLAGLENRFGGEVVQCDQVQVVVGRVLERWTGKVDAAKVVYHLSSRPKVQRPTGRDERNLAKHREDLIGRWVDREDDAAI